MVAMATRGDPDLCHPHPVKVHEVGVTYHMGSVGEMQVFVALRPTWKAYAEFCTEPKAHFWTDRCLSAWGCLFAMATQFLMLHMSLSHVYLIYWVLVRGKMSTRSIFYYNTWENLVSHSHLWLPWQPGGPRSLPPPPNESPWGGGHISYGVCGSRLNSHHMAACDSMHVSPFAFFPKLIQARGNGRCEIIQGLKG